jgi:hypothetical protein
MQPFQDFALLVDLRNLIMHAKPAKTEAVRRKEAGGEWTWENKILSGLAQRGAISAKTGIPSQFIPEGERAQIQSNLLAEISTQSVASWSCTAASGIVNSLLNDLPSSPTFAPMIQNIYRTDFGFPDN